MRLFKDSEVFQYLDSGNVIQGKIHKILSGKSGAIALNNALSANIKSMQKIFKDPVTVKAVNALNSGEMVLISIPANFNLPECLPYIKFMKNGKPHIYVNVTKYATETRIKDSDEVEYNIDIKKLYSLVVPAVLYLQTFDEKYVATPDTLRISAIIWARMFNKVLNRAIGLATNKEKYEAFMYFGVKFFLKYYMEAKDAIIEDIANSILKNGRTFLIESMEQKIKDLQLEPFESFTGFCSVLFNNEISNLKGLRINNVEEAMNSSFYLKRFIDMYNVSALMSLGSYPFFIFTIFSAYNWSGIVNDRTLEEVVYADKREITKLMTSLYKDL